jgi:hypothetical protein
VNVDKPLDHEPMITEHGLTERQILQTHWHAYERRLSRLYAATGLDRELSAAE